MVDIPLDASFEAPASGGGFDFSNLAAIGVGFLFLFFLTLLVFLIKRITSRPESHGLSREEIRAKWEEIERIASQGTMGAKMAIVEADKLLDGALKSIMLPGETMGERLKSGCYKYPELRDVWFAHKLRNQLVHEATFEIGSRDAVAAIRAFKKALKTIRMM